MGGAPIHTSNDEAVARGGGGPDSESGLLKFDEIVLESNEIDLAELQSLDGFTERRFP